jgi:hypothetical protein
VEAFGLKRLMAPGISMGRLLMGHEMPPGWQVRKHKKSQRKNKDDGNPKEFSRAVVYKARGHGQPPMSETPLH